LTYLFGLGRSLSCKILADLEIDKDIKVGELSADDVTKLRNYLNEKVRIEGDLRSEVAMNIKRLIDINSYRGTRHRKKLPSRGQRTKTNNRTRRGGKRQTMAGRKK
jgi:small subunit ribosomal protein S13